MVVFRLVSQPLALLPSQLPQPAAQTGAQLPALHEVVPCALVHPSPQAPQLLTLFVRFVSQPLFGFPSQLPQPPRHAGAQPPETQAVLPFGLTQVWPQPPQLLTLVLMLVSHPLPELPSQLAKPGVQPS